MNKNWKNGYCERCGERSNSFSGSYFNTDVICPVCCEEESNHPKMAYAKEVENNEVLKGNYSYPGVGLPDDLKVKYAK